MTKPDLSNLKRDAKGNILRSELLRINKPVLRQLDEHRRRTVVRWLRGRKYWNAWARKILECQKEMDNNKHSNCIKELKNCKHCTISNFSDIVFATIYKYKHSDITDNKIIINNMLDFSDILFPNNVEFNNSKFMCDIFFNNSIFYGIILFRNSKFYSNCNFWKSIFQNEVRFWKVIFRGNVDFKKSFFNKNVSFRESEFSGIANFYKAKFRGDAYFNEVDFYKNLSFSGSKFSRRANFANSRFNIDDGRANFSNVKFKHISTYRRVIFLGNIDFYMSEFMDRSIFSEAEFYKKIDFSVCIFNKGAAIDRAYFHGGVPDFSEAAFHAPPVLDDVQIEEQLRKRDGPLSFCSLWDVTHQKALDVSRRFRVLGKMAHEARDWLKEMEFFAQEIRTRRFGLDFPLGSSLLPLFQKLEKLRDWWVRYQLRHFPEHVRHVVRLYPPYKQPLYPRDVFGPRVGRFWFGWVYEVLSDFGRSFARPFFAWLASVGVFAFIYLGFAKADGLGDALAFSFRHGTIVSGLVRSPHYQQLLCNLFTKGADKVESVEEKKELVEACLGKPVKLLEMSNWLYGFTILQTVLSAFFLFLFFLAVRNHFRIR